MLTIFTDGAGWNGVLSECAFVIYQGEECWFESHYVTYNECTNNEMEYKAMLLALEYLHQNLVLKGLARKADRVVIRSDSQLVVNQVMGKWSVNYKHLEDYTTKCKKLIGEIIVPVHIEWTHRNKNRAGIFIERKQKERKKQNAKSKNSNTKAR